MEAFFFIYPRCSFIVSHMLISDIMRETLFGTFYLPFSIQFNLKPRESLFSFLLLLCGSSECLLCVFQSVETVCTLYHSLQDASGGLMEVRKETTGPDVALLRPCPRHMSVTERLRKVVQELVDTEKSYVKVKPELGK